MRNHPGREPQIREFLAAVGENEPDVFRAEQMALRILRNLPERSQRILQLRYGLGTEISWTLQEIGLEFGLTRERVRQIIRSSLEKLGRHHRQKESYERA